MKSFVLSLAVLALEGLSACSKAPSAAPQDVAAAARAAQTANGRCPVMKGLVEPDGGASEYQGIKVGFCCRSCIAKFQAEPERYLKVMRDDRATYGYTGP